MLTFCFKILNISIYRLNTYGKLLNYSRYSQEINWLNNAFWASYSSWKLSSGLWWSLHLYECKFYTQIIFMGLSAPCHFCAQSIECAHIKPHLDVKIPFIPMMRGRFWKQRVFFFPSEVKLGFWEHLGKNTKCLQKNSIVPYSIIFVMYVCIYYFIQRLSMYVNICVDLVEL